MYIESIRNLPKLQILKVYHWVNPYAEAPNKVNLAPKCFFKKIH